MKDCWLLQNFKENQKKRANQTGRNRDKGRDDPRNRPAWKRDKGVTFDVAARSNPCVVTKGPVQPRPPDRQPPTTPLAATGNAQTLPATDSGVPPGKILLDSGATFTAVNKPMPGIKNIKNSDWTMTFGNGHVAPIEQLGSIGGLKDVAICKGMHVAVASVSHLAKDLECVTVFTGERAYILRPGATANIKAADVILTAKQKNGLYTITTSQFVEAVIDNSPDDESSDDE